ncbi:MAG: molybdenum cofactor biosynthesis protein MoaE [Deltaproteobacteria bacterium]|jgi:molybdopterin synthase catalytic subunit|nr:molybdenum cofactor biosynthesis protein MoaE [Deltaproteobacteria bacterium]MCL5879794.1 molybdenum cofactor biosynthesis protein MoaE [Deltaproteobacteria bacterium]MDA8303923.1 molybdenum cofactor biosynthesis protein MoaE [Deltaproteobacteria bacterium]
MINVKVRLFAALKELIGKNQIDLSVPENSSVEDVVKTLGASYPEVKNILSISKFAVNMEYQDIKKRLSNGDEVTIIMPVSGGASGGINSENPPSPAPPEADKKILIEITESEIAPNKVLDFVSDPSAGSILLFNGTVRDNEDAKPVKYLFYEAYEEMAVKEMQKLIKRVFEDYEISKVAIIHRLGRIDIGGISISIGVSSPHRKDSYLASKFLIDNIKETVPIWKKETFEGFDKWKRI